VNTSADLESLRVCNVKITVVAPYFTALYGQNEYGLCRTLAAHGHEVTLITSNRRMKKFYFDSRQWRIGRKRRARLENFDVVYLPTLLDAMEQPLMPTMLAEILGKDCEIVHGHEDFQSSTFLSYAASRLRRRPFVLSEERYYFPSALGARLLYKSYARLFCKLVQTGAYAITAHSNAAKRFLVAQGVPPEKVTVIPVGIDTGKFKKVDGPGLRNSFATEPGPLLLTVARLHPNKGLEYLIRALRKARAEIPGINLAIVGRGPLEKKLRDLTISLGLKEAIHFVSTGIPNEKMPAVYSASDIFVLPSVKEPFGRVLLEAMSCELPVIAARVAGPLEIVADGQTGFLVEPRSEEELVEKITWMVQHRIHAKDMGRNGRERVKRYFDWNIVVKEYLKIYESAIRR